ncbi:uncharacterized protein LOC143227530 [Tachypleus tridentatus]|uniref:uncharacterized protein LOC143227530 n=1 Tax=Tachypleus tridentatus TaxID=6853 RepID=UPI003FCF799D
MDQRSLAFPTHYAVQTSTLDLRRQGTVEGIYNNADYEVKQVIAIGDSLTQHVLQQEKKDLQSIHDSISSDHEALQKLHDQLTTEYENLSSEYNALKSSHRSLKSDLAALKERSEKEIFSQEELEKLREILDQEKHLVDKQSFVDLQCKYCELKEEWNSLKESFDSLQVEHKKLQAAHKSLRTEDSNLKLENTRLKGDLVEFQDQAATLDIQVSKLIGYCKALFQANGIENEQGTLVDQIFSLLADYQNYLVSMSGDSFPSVTETELGRRLYVLTQEKKERGQIGLKTSTRT